MTLNKRLRIHEFEANKKNDVKKQKLLFLPSFLKIKQLTIK